MGSLYAFLSVFSCSSSSRILDIIALGVLAAGSQQEDCFSPGVLSAPNLLLTYLKLILGPLDFKVLNSSSFDSILSGISSVIELSLLNTLVVAGAKFLL